MRTAPLTLNAEAFLLTSEVLDAQRRNAFLRSARFPMVYRIRDEPRADALENALRLIASRHSAFRSEIVPSERYSPDQRRSQLAMFKRTSLFVSGMYYLRISPDNDVLIRRREAIDEADLDTVIEQEMTAQCDPLSGRLSGVIVPLKRSGAVVIVVASHLNVDGWSARQFSQELVRIYNTYVGHPRPPLPVVDADIAGFAGRQLERLWSGGFQEEARFWADQWGALDGAVIARQQLPFASRGHMSTVRRYSAARVETTLSTETTIRIGSTLATFRLTTYAFFRAAFYITLYVLTNKQRIAVWTNFANRQDPTLERTIAWCANSHLIATELRPNLSCSEFCRSVGKQIQGAQGYEALPMVGLWHLIGADLNRGDCRIFFDMVSAKPSRRETSAISGQLVSRRVDISDLDVRVRDTGGPYVFQANFDPGRFEADGVRSTLEVMAVVADYMASHPRASVAAAADLGAQRAQHSRVECGITSAMHL